MLIFAYMDSTTSSKGFADLGKAEAIRQLYEGSGYTPSDGCAFVPEKDAENILSVVMMQEGLDFDLTYFPLKHLGFKSVVRVTGRLIARMARPRVLSLTLGLSAKLDFPQVQELWSGVVAAAKEYGYLYVDLDLVPSLNGLTISLSSVGETGGALLRKRRAPRSKDLLCVTGSLGAAYLGYRILEREKKHFLEKKDDHIQPDLSAWKMLVAAYLKPESGAGLPARMEESDVVPSAGIFVTDGLADAVKQLVRQTGLGAKVYAEKIPFAGNTFALSQDLDIDPVSAAMNGGQDLCYLFVLPLAEAERFRRDFQTFDIIGHLALPDVGAVLVTPEGAELPLSAQGWNDVS